MINSSTAGSMTIFCVLLGFIPGFFLSSDYAYFLIGNSSFLYGLIAYFLMIGLVICCFL
jgi:hypothetical protein